MASIAKPSKSTSFPDFTPIDGGCYCNKAAYTLFAPPIFINGCHCHNCQKLTGAAFAINIQVETEFIKISSANNGIVVTDNKDSEGKFSGSSTRCAHCNTMLFATHPFTGPNISYLRAGTLNLETEEHYKLVVPSAHFFTRSKHPWIKIPEGAKQYEKLPDKEEWEGMFPNEGKERIERAMKMVRSEQSS